MEYLGVNNCNPLNVKQMADPKNFWDGSRGEDAYEHAIFVDPIYGVRAACRCLAKKALECSTWRKLFESYAPPSDGNDPATYAAFVARAVSSHSDGKVELFDLRGRIIDRNRLYLTLAAMIEFENFAGYELSASVIRSGIAMYQRDFCAGR